MAAALACACKPATEMTDAQRTAIGDSVSAAYHALFASVATRNVDSILAFYAPGDAWVAAELGMVYPSSDSVRAAFRSFFGGLRAVEMTPDAPRVQVLGPTAAVATATFHGTATDTTGVTQELRAAYSAVYERRAEGWKIVQTHESVSMPAPPPAPARRR
jgi:uncharacterized protein (TIGR02246 family)